MVFSLDRKCPRLIDFFYNHAELAANVLFYVLLVLGLVVAVIVVPEKVSNQINALPFGYKAMIVAITGIGLGVFFLLVSMLTVIKDDQAKRQSSQSTGYLSDENDWLTWSIRSGLQALEREKKLFRRLSDQEQKLLLDNYVDKEKNHFLDRDDPSTQKLLKRGYIKQIGDQCYCLSNRTCDVFDACYEELKALVSEAEAPDSFDENKQTPTTSSEDMHPDAVVARKYAEGDPETIRKLSIFDP